MFIRTTTHHRPNGGTTVVHRLVENRREGGKVRQRTLLNLGANYALPRELWKPVARLTRSLLQGEAPLFEPEAAVVAEAEKLARRVRARQLAEDREGAGKKRGSKRKRGSRMMRVDLDTLEHEGARSVGGERLCLAALKELGFGERLRELGLSDRDARIATALVVAKMLHPSSELEAERWLRDSSAALELLGLDGSRGVSDTKLLRIGDALWRRQAELQAGLYARERVLLGQPEAVVFYDLTNTWHSGGRKAEGEGLLRFGRSKQRRNDCRLVTLALALDSLGFPRDFAILPGNASEPATLKEALSRLERSRRPGEARPTVVLDAGISTKESLGWLREAGHDWVTVARSRRPVPPEGDPDVKVETRARHEVRAWRMPEEDGEEGEDGAEELRLCVVSEGRKATDEQVLERRREKFEEELVRLHEGLGIPRRMKRYDLVQQKVGRLRERYPRVAGQYRVEVERERRPKPKGKSERKSKAKWEPKAVAVRFERREKYDEADASAGAYLLRTSQVEWEPERVVRTYWRLTGIEATFRSLKTDLGLRPIWHRKASRIKAHLFIALLAYHAVRLIRTRLRKRGIRLSWRSIRERLRPWVRVTTTVRAADGALIVNRQDVRPDAEAAELARGMGVRALLYRRRRVLRDEESARV